MILPRNNVSLVMICSAFVFLCSVVLEGSVIVCWLSKGQSVIEEKGEGFENGKKFVGSFGVPSTSGFPPNYIARLKT